MKIEKISEKENPMLKRKELKIRIAHEKSATPAKAALQQLLANELKKDAEHIDIKNITSDVGKAMSFAKVFVWEEKKVDLSKKAFINKEKEEKKE